MKINLGCITMLLTLFLLACSAKIDEHAVVGTYIANHSCGQEKLELHANGIYVLTYEVPGKPKFRNENKWEFRLNKDGISELRFDNFMFGRIHSVECPDPNPSREPGYWIVPVDVNWFGKLSLQINGDVGDAYIHK